MEDLPKWTSTTLDLTEGCNLACDYCFTHSEHKYRSMTPEMGMRILDWWMPQVDKEQEAQVSFWGGEPLLEWELLKMLRHYSYEKAKELQIKSIIWGGTTNGLLYTPDKVEWCRDNNSKLLISLDGIQPSHDLHRCTRKGEGSWKIVDHNVREALKVDPQTRVRLTLSPDNVQYFYESMLYFFEDLGLTHVAYSPVTEAEWTEETFELLEEQYDLIVNYMHRKVKDGNRVEVKHIDDDARLHLQGQQTQFNPCGAGIHYAGWSVDGYLFPCHRFNKHGLTSEQRHNSPLILARPKGDSFEWVGEGWRRQFCDFAKNAPSDCKECKIYNCSACRGGCFATNYDITGDINLHSANGCRLTKLQNAAAVKYAEILKKDGLDTIMNLPNEHPTSCICYNMCYCEGTENEIITANNLYPGTCTCFATQNNVRSIGTTRDWSVVREEKMAMYNTVQAIEARLKLEEEMTAWQWIKLGFAQAWKRIIK